MIWKTPSFFASTEAISGIMAKARKHNTLIVDLRGNPGGAVDTLKEVLGHLFDQDFKLADRVARKNTKPEMVKSIKGNVFSGKLIVLVDGSSASCAELFARVIQLEKRGTVIGDRTAGAVMEARHYDETVGMDTKVFFGYSVTYADLLMADGKSLEKTGVIPDTLVLPTAADLANGRDPVLAQAAELAGATLDPVAAGKLFPYEWPPL
jgi:carboxyl-terminal processing protease